MSDLQLFVEETLPNDSGYQVLWRGKEEGGDWEEAFKQIKSLPSNNRLELWNKALGGSPNGFAPFAYREKGKETIMVCQTLMMLMGIDTRAITDKLKEEKWLETMKAN